MEPLNQQSSKIYHAEDGKIIFNPPPDSEQVARENQQRIENTFKQDQVATNRRLTLLNVCLVVCTVIGSAINFWQGRTSQRAAIAAETAATIAQKTLNEMKTGGGAVDTHTLAMQAVTQSDQTKRQADQTEKLASSSVQQIKAANQLALQAQRSADYAHQAIGTEIEANRAWVGVTGFYFGKSDTSDGDKVFITMTNSGRRPAISRYKSGDAFFKSFPVAPFAEHNFRQSEAVLLPGASTQGSFPLQITPGMIEGARKNGMKEYFFVELVYSDGQTGTPYITHFCSYKDSFTTDSQWLLCPFYNDVK